MACCDGDLSGAVKIDYADLPEETFCCMGRMAYTIANKASEILLNDVNPGWDQINERQKLQLGARTKAFMTGGSMGDTPFDRLMEAILVSMTSAR